MSKFKRVETGINDLVVIEPTVYEDSRGFFMETYNKKDFADIGLGVEFVQDNLSMSQKGVFRGLHFQTKMSQGKLVRVTSGAVLDITVDLRFKSKTFGQWFTVELTAENRRQLYVPKGFAHGFMTLKDGTEFLYKCTNYYAPKYDSGIIWNDKDLAIDYSFEKYGINVEELLLSAKDQKLQTFKEFVDSGVKITS